MYPVVVGLYVQSVSVHSQCVLCWGSLKTSPKMMFYAWVGSTNSCRANTSLIQCIPRTVITISLRLFLSKFLIQSICTVSLTLLSSNRVQPVSEGTNTKRAASRAAITPQTSCVMLIHGEKLMVMKAERDLAINLLLICCKAQCHC